MLGPVTQTDNLDCEHSADGVRQIPLQIRLQYGSLSFAAESVHDLDGLRPMPIGRIPTGSSACFYSTEQLRG